MPIPEEELYFVDQFTESTRIRVTVCKEQGAACVETANLMAPAGSAIFQKIQYVRYLCILTQRADLLVPFLNISISLPASVWLLVRYGNSDKNLPCYIRIAYLAKDMKLTTTPNNIKQEEAAYLQISRQL